MRTSFWYIYRSPGALEGEQKQLQTGGDAKDDAQENEGRLHRTSPERVEDKNEYCWKKYLTGFVCEEERGTTINRCLNDSQSSEWVQTSPLRKSPVKCPICHIEGEWCHCLLSGKSSRWSPEQAGFHPGGKSYEDSRSEKPVMLCSAFQVPQPVHSEKKIYECGECGKKFKGNSRLKQHQRIHTKEEPHKCHECGCSFRKRSHLTEHQQIHSGEKPFLCEECGRRFTKLSNLTIHKQVHSGERPYQCKECGQTFTQSFHLAVHQQIHTGGKMYACKECGRCFTFLVDFTIHQRSHSGENSYHCE